MGNTCCVQHQRKEHQKKLLQARSDGKSVGNGGNDNPVYFEDENEAYTWFLQRSHPGNNAELLRNAITIKKRDSSVLTNGTNLGTPHADDKCVEKHLLLNEDRQNLSLGINIAGSLQKGIFVNQIVEDSIAEESQSIFKGDRIVSVTVYFEQISYQDALNILKVSAKYKVGLHLQESATQAAPEFNQPHTSLTPVTVTSPERQLETPMIPQLFVNSESPSALTEGNTLRQASSLPTIYQPISKRDQPVSFERTTSLPKCVAITHRPANSIDSDVVFNDNEADNVIHCVTSSINSTADSDSDDVIDFSEPFNALNPELTDTHVDANTSGSIQSASIFDYRTPSVMSSVSSEIKYVENINSSPEQDSDININSPPITISEQTYSVDEKRDTLDEIPDIEHRERTSIARSLRGSIESYVPADLGDFVGEFELEMSLISPNNSDNGVFFAKLNESFADNELLGSDDAFTLDSIELVEEQTEQKDSSINDNKENNSVCNIDIGNLAAAILDGKSPKKQDTDEKQFRYSTPNTKGNIEVEQLKNLDESVNIKEVLENKVASSNNSTITEERRTSFELSNNETKILLNEKNENISVESSTEDDCTETTKPVEKPKARVTFSLERNTEEQYKKKKTGFGFHLPKLGRKSQSNDKTKTSIDDAATQMGDESAVNVAIGANENDVGYNGNSKNEGVDNLVNQETAINSTVNTDETTATTVISTSEGEVVVTLRLKKKKVPTATLR